MEESDSSRLLVGIVGPCGSGKSTLAENLEGRGFRCRHIAQEHSYVPYMWKHMTNPDALIFLDASYQTCTARRQLNWKESDYLEQQRRLSHARQHADLIIQTDSLTIDQVFEQTLKFLQNKSS